MALFESGTVDMHHSLSMEDHLPRASARGLVIAALLASVAATSQTLPPIYDKTPVERANVATVSEFRAGTFLENLAIDAKGDVFVTSYLEGKVYRIGADGRKTTWATMIWVETQANPTLRLHDLGSVAAVARAHGALTVADNTFCTPCLTRPIEHGIDLVTHSMTKYLGGHGDVIGGVVMGREQLVAPVRHTGLNHLAGSLSPHSAFLFLRGLQTLPLRMAAHCEGAARVAAFLNTHPAVRRVLYPGLASHQNHALAQRQ